MRPSHRSLKLRLDQNRLLDAEGSVFDFGALLCFKERRLECISAGAPRL